MATVAEPISATGRRKTSVARARLQEGTGELTINGRPLDTYFPTIQLQNIVLEPFHTTNLTKKFDVQVNASGGGLPGQAGAISLAIARALIEHDKELRPPLKAAGLLRRDPRMKERKKAGQPGARKRFQFSKR